MRLSLGFSFAAVAAVSQGRLEGEQTKLLVNIINQLNGRVFPDLCRFVLALGENQLWFSPKFVCDLAPGHLLFININTK